MYIRGGGGRWLPIPHPWKKALENRHKKVTAQFRFFFLTDWTFFRPVPYPVTINKRILKKNPLNYYSLKVTKFHGDKVKNESARTKKLRGGLKRPLPPAFLGLKKRS